MAEKQKLLAVYAYIDDLLAAVGRLKIEKASIDTVYSPAPNEHLDKALGTKASRVRLFVLCGAIAGLLTGASLAIYAATRWNLIVWGKPPISLVPYVVVCFEFCVLMAVLSGIAGFLILSRMPRYKIPAHFDARFTIDRYGLLLTCPAGQRDRIAGLLRETGAEEVRDAAV